MPATEVDAAEPDAVTRARLAAAQAVEAGDLMVAEQQLTSALLQIGDGISTLTANLYRDLAAVWRGADRLVQADGLELAAQLMEGKVREAGALTIEERRALVQTLRGEPEQRERLGAELFALAQAEHAAGQDFGAARGFLEEAVSLGLELSPASRETAFRQALLVTFRAKSGDDEAALALGDAVRDEVWAADPGLASEMLRTTSQIRFRLGRQKEARQDALLAVETATQSGSDHLMAAARSLLALLDQQDGDLSAAAAGYREALRLFDGDGSGPSVPSAINRVRLGEVEKRLGHSESAGEAFQQAVDMLRACAPASRELAAASEFLGVHRAEQSEYPAALAALREAERLYPKGREKLLLTVRIGDVLKHRGRFPEAKTELENVLRDARDLGLPDVVDVALMTLAGVHRWLGELDEAEGSYRALLERADTPADRGNVLANLGGIHYERAEYAQAAALYAEARELLAEEDATTRATIVLNLATARHGQGKLEEAERLYLEALPALPSASRTRIEAVTGRAKIASAQGRTDEAIALFAEGVALIEQLRTTAGGDLFAMLLSNYVQLQFLLASRQAPGDADWSLELAEMTRARSLDEELRKRSTRLDEGAAAATARRSLAVASRKRMAAVADPQTPPYLLADVERRERELERELEAHRDSAGPTAPSPVLTAAQIAAALPDDGVLVEFAVVGRQMHAWAVSQIASVFRVLPDNVDAIGELVLHAVGPCHTGSGTDGWSAEAWEALGRAVLAPLGRLVETAGTLFICPAGPLHYISFEPFVDGPAIIYVPSATVGLGARAEAKATQTLSADFVGFGNPLFDRELPEFRAYPPLPGAQLEVQEIAAMFGEQGRAFCGAAAIEPEVRSWARRCRYLHLATHGFFDLDNPMRTGLLLASPTTVQVAGHEFDDVLYAYEMVDLRTSAELVVCASCYTGFGDVRAGEGMASIGGALLVGGARWVVVSLWPVGDLVTATFTLALYRSIIAGSAVPRAVDVARREVREYHDNPRFWAPFVLFGVQR